MVLLNLKQVDATENAIREGKAGNLRVIDAITESRENHNILVNALNQISKQIEELSTKVDRADNTELSKTVDTIMKTTIPEIRNKADRNREVLEAKIVEAVEKASLKHEQLEAHGRRLNLIWNGRPEEKIKAPTANGGSREIEDTETLFRKFLVENLHFQSEYVDSIILRGIHRLPKNPKMKGPPPIIIAFICMKHRNDVLAAAKELKDTPFSLKSDLPYELNKIRTEMLNEKRRLKNDENEVVRLVERNYLPVLQIRDKITKAWKSIMSIGQQGFKSVAIKSGQIPTRNEAVAAPAHGGEDADAGMD